MNDLKDSIKDKIESAFADMSAHSYNNYTDDSEYTVVFTVRELKWLNGELQNDNKGIYMADEELYEMQQGIS